MELEFPWQIFEKSSGSKFMKIRLEGTELFSAGRRTDRHDEANSCSLKFCECAWKSCKCLGLLGCDTIVGWVVSNDLKECNDFILKGQVHPF
jgi:hypothetical protein